MSNSRKLHQKVIARLSRVRAKPIIPASVLAYVLGSETHVNAADETALRDESAGVERTRAALREIPPQVTMPEEATLL